MEVLLAKRKKLKGIVYRRTPARARRAIALPERLIPGALGSWVDQP
jgi:hypothetical protein